MIYERKDGRVILICPIHGEFSLKAENHMNGKSGCRACRDQETGIKNRLTTEKFIYKSRLVHGNKYDYSKSVYTISSDRLIVTCKEHGDFYVTANSHLMGGGCHKCYGNIKLTTSEFIKRATNEHSGRYNYSSVNYINFDTKVKIICKKHGVFECSPRNHLQLKNGCPKCSISKSEWFICKWFERNGIEYVFQKSFHTCRFKKKLRFDFWLPGKDILLEFDGKQHFEVDNPRREYILLRDKIKEDWAEKNGIPLIRIGYLEKLEQKLIEYFL